ncbi:phage tail protein [Nitrolancea hollandica]|uniref:Uncharacterized protein n=1 Tax=Nitrolancea hollandica Lb TaxID=1129897 RepID=I4EG39_9BACT|nr:hypothetical protein [Nitrolancea hollandica]CCF83651.1 membrane hypothetical protein [Nitrolancea hollandica Lb]
MAKDSQLKINIVGDASQIRKVFGQAEESAGRFGKAIGGVASAAGGFLAANVIMKGFDAAVGGAARAVFGLNNEYEAAQTRIMAFTKDQAMTADILSKVRDEANKTPFAFNEMANATAALIPTAKMANVSWEELLKTGEILAASNPMEGLEGASFALKEAVSGDFTSIIERFNLSRQTINRLKDEGVPALEIVRQAMAEQGLDASLVAGMAETAAGRWATFQDTIDGLKMSLTKPIFEGLKNGLTALQGVFDANSERLTRFAETVGNALGGALQGAISFLSETVIPTFQGFFQLLTADKFSGFVDGMATIQGALTRAFGADTAGRITQTLGGIATFITETALPAVQSFFGFLQRHAGTIATIAGAVLIAVKVFGTLTTVVSAVSGVFATISGIVAGVSAAWAGLTTAFGAFFISAGATQGILGSLIAILGGPVTVAIAAVAGTVALLAAAWVNNWGDIRGKTAAAWEILKSIFQSIQERFSQFVSQILPELAAAWESLSSKIGSVLKLVGSLVSAFWTGVIQPTFNAITGFIQRHGDDIVSILSRVWNLISGTISNVTSIISNVIQLALNIIQGDWKGAWENIKAIGSTLWDQIKLVISTAAGILRDLLSIIWGEIKTKASDTWNGIKTTFENGKDALKNALLWPFERARDAIGGIMDGFKRNLAGPWNAAADGINNFIVGVGLAVNWASRKLTGSDLFSWGGMPSVPRFARGGVHQGGLMIAGEEGEELLVAPRGTRVFSHRDTVDLFRTLNDRPPEGVPLGPNGPLGLGAGPLDGVVSAVKNMAGSAVEAVRSVIDKGVTWLIDQALGALHLDTGAGALGGIGRGVFSHVTDLAKTTITKLFETVKKALPSLDAPAGYPGGNAILDMAFRTPGAYMWCEKFIGDVYQRLGLHYTRAASAAQHARMQPLNPGTGPAGAVVFLPWDTYGHVAFSLGDGRIYGTANTPSGKGVMNAWSGAGWTVNPAANGLHATNGPVLSLLNEANPTEGEIAAPVPMLRRIVSEEAGGDVIEGGMLAALNDLYKPLGKAGQAFSEVVDTILSGNKALDSLLDLSKEGAVQVQGSIVTLADSNKTSLLANKDATTKVQQSVDTMAAGTASGLSRVDSSVLGVGGAVDGVGDSVDAMAGDSRSAFQKVLSILQGAISGASPWHVITDGGAGPGGPATDINGGGGGDVVGGNLTPGMGGLINPPPPGSKENPIVLTPANPDVISGGLTPGMTNLLSDKTTVNGDIIVGPGPVGGTTINEDVLLGPLPKFARGGVFDRPVVGIFGEGRDREIASPEPLLRQIVREETRLGAGITVNINGPITVNSRADIDRLGNDVAVSIRAALRRQGRA